MRRYAVLLLLLPLAACTTGSGRPRPGYWDRDTASTAAKLDLPPCPASIRAQRDGDWREVHSDGVAICVPATWKRGPRLSWFTEGITIALFDTPSAADYFPRKFIGPASVVQYKREEINGLIVEMWADRRSSFEYASYGLVRELNRVFEASTRRSRDIELTRQVFRTLRVKPMHSDRLPRDRQR